MPSPEPASTAKIYFSDFFNLSPLILEDYGAFNVSLINDLPLFVDPFLLFNSEKPEYRALHDQIITYLRFLRDQAEAGTVNPGLLQAWYQFKEVRQNWLGFSKVGNRGSALGPQFAQALHANLGTIFRSFGEETITRGSHLEKVCLTSNGIGRDNVSDFTTSLIKGFLLDYTQSFARDYLTPSQRSIFAVEKAQFNYTTRSWQTERYELPCHEGDYLLLTPKDILTRDEIWISRQDLWNNFEQVAAAVPDEQLRAQLNDYLYAQLSHGEALTDQEREERRRTAVESALRVHPEIIEYYIRDKEDDGERATAISAEKVGETAEWFVDQVQQLVRTRLAGTEFYASTGKTYEEARQRVLFLKHVIEHQDGYRLFYHDGMPLQRESDLQLLFKFTWYASTADVNSEVNNGRGPVDFAVSRGRRDKSLVEFKLASNSKLKQNLKNQVAIYEAASGAQRSIKVICFFSDADQARATRVLQELELENNQSIILIDARADNKPSASTA